MTSPRQRTGRGAVTAELALGLPVLMAVTVGLVWLLSVGAAQVRTVDAARETARAVARGDDEGAAVAVGERVAPDGVRVEVVSSEGRVVVRAAGHVSGPGGIFSFLPGADVGAEAVALAEEEP
ncbi:TadE family protein [Nocardioides sp. HM23]|uniref:TadE family protein n=1 Tax=Nocardioides bizhenqiangii TaxID=3095076 RepID=UPI002ACA8A9E|nr:TadE family protein [Nocardioides sp. HM23]MDZ5622562.1 TadE family protein [Nocardioides sp. HM23]